MLNQNIALDNDKLHILLKENICMSLLNNTSNPELKEKITELSNKFSAESLFEFKPFLIVSPPGHGKNYAYNKAIEEVAKDLDLVLISNKNQKDIPPNHLFFLTLPTKEFLYELKNPFPTDKDKSFKNITTGTILFDDFYDLNPQEQSTMAHLLSSKKVNHIDLTNFSFTMLANQTPYFDRSLADKVKVVRFMPNEDVLKKIKSIREPGGNSPLYSSKTNI